jgi:ABC-2 type transport system ATP-binding protein
MTALTSPTATLTAQGLSRRYGSVWALRDCSLTLPAGRVVGLVGPNGAGKTTLIHLALGLLEPTAGAIQVLGYAPRDHEREVLARVGFVAQQRPLYKQFTVEQHLQLGAHLNARWDDVRARERLRRYAIPLDRKVRTLSGGQQAQVALTLALGKRPQLLLLDEPLAELDPLARQEFLRTLLVAATEEGITVLFSSHVVAELERFCDYLIILLEGQVRVAGDVDELLAAHQRLSGVTASDLRSDASDARAPSAPRGAAWSGSQTAAEDALAREAGVVAVTRGGGQTTLIVRQEAELPRIGWEVGRITLEELVLAYMANPSQSLILPPAAALDGALDSGEVGRVGNAEHRAENREERAP